MSAYLNAVVMVAEGSGGREVKGPKVLAFTREMVTIFSGF